MEIDDPRKGAKALILFQDKYLFLLRNSKDKIAPSEWDLPGGGVESGETLKEALAREVKEETGIDISSLNTPIIKTWEGYEKKTKISGTDFLCILDEPHEIILSQEHVRAQWLTKDEALNSKEIPIWLKEDVKLAAKLIENVK